MRKIIETEIEIPDYCDVCNRVTIHLKSPTGAFKSCSECGIETPMF